MCSTHYAAPASDDESNVFGHCGIFMLLNDTVGSWNKLEDAKAKPEMVWVCDEIKAILERY